MNGGRRIASTLIVSFVGACSIEGRAADTSRRPNILFVFSDEHSRDMVGCYGNTQIITPNFDRLADQGMRFDYCFSSYPVCTPYRSMLLSGQHVLRNGCLGNDLRLLPSAGPFLGRRCEMPATTWATSASGVFTGGHATAPSRRVLCAMALTALS